MNSDNLTCYTGSATWFQATQKSGHDVRMTRFLDARMPKVHILNLSGVANIDIPALLLKARELDRRFLLRDSGLRLS